MRSSATGTDDDDEEAYSNTFRHSAAVEAIAAWSRQARASASPSPGTPTKAHELPWHASPSVSPVRERTPTRITTSLPAGGTTTTVSEGREGVLHAVYPSAPPSSSTVFSDRPFASVVGPAPVLTRLRSPSPLGSLERQPASPASYNEPSEPPSERTADQSAFDVELRLAQAQRERLEKMLQRQEAQTRAPLAARADVSSVSPVARSPPPRSLGGDGTQQDEPVVSSPFSQRARSASASARIPPDSDAERAAETPQASPPSYSVKSSPISAAAASPNAVRHRSGVSAAMRHRQGRPAATAGFDDQYWQLQLALIDRLRRSSMHATMSAECQDDSPALAAYRRRGALDTPYPGIVTYTPDEPQTPKRLTAVPPMWDMTGSGNVLIGEEGTVAIAEMGRAYAEIAREYGVPLTSVSRLAVVPMYSIGTQGVSAGHMTFSVRLWSTLPAPLSLPPSPGGIVPSAVKRFAVGVATADFKGPQTAAPSFLFWSNGTAAATCGAEAAAVPYGIPFTVEDQITSDVNMEQGLISFSVNHRACGVAFRFILAQHPDPLYPVVVFVEDGDAATLTYLAI